MRTITLWARRSSAPWLLVVLVPIVVLVVTSRSGWAWQGQWALSWGAGTTLVIGPIVAGMVAFDYRRRLTPTIRLLGRTSARGVRATLGLPLALLAAATSAWAVGMVVVIVRSAQVSGRASATTIGAYLALGVACLMAAAGCGLAVGTWCSNAFAGPVAAVLTYAIAVVAVLFDVRGVLAVGGATGPTFGMVPRSSVVGYTIGVNVLIACTTVSFAIDRWGIGSRTGTVRSAMMTGALGIALVMMAGAGTSTPFVETRAASLCLGTAPQVCGPPDARSVMQVAHHDLSNVHRMLAHQEFNDLPTRYDLVTGTAPDVGNDGLLSVEPALITGGHLDPWDVALSVATPASCVAYRSDTPPESLLNGQGWLASWIVHNRDSATDSGRRPPADVAHARLVYDALRRCDASTLTTLTARKPS